MGEVHVSFITSYDPGHSFLAPFNLHRQVLGVLGLSTLNSMSSLQELEHSPGALRQLHPSAVVHRVFAFDTGASRPETVDLSSLKNPLDAIEKAGQAEVSPTSGFAGRATSGLVVFPSVRKDLKDVRFYLKTLVPDFVGGILDGLDTIVKGLQGKSMETPRETLDGNLTTAATPTLPISSISMATSAANSAVGTAASRASALFSSFSPEEKKSSRNSKASQSLASIGPMGAGRYAKVKADYFLLSGDLWNALHTYDSCMNLLGKERAIAGGQDAVWYASALEGWAVTRFLVMRMGGPVEDKATCLTLPLGGTKEEKKEKDKDKERSEFQFYDKIWSDIAEAYSLALAMYTKCLAPLSYLLESWKSITPDTPRDYTHPLIHSSACLAYARFLLAIWASGGWNGETCDQLLYGGTPPALAETTRPTQAVYTQHCTASGVQRSDIAAPASLAMTNSSTNGLKLLDQIHLFSSLASIFGAVGFVRKETYSIRRLQALVVSLIISGTHLQKKETSTASRVLRTNTNEDESQVYGTMTTTIFTTGAGQNADSILVLALQICQTYGIDIEKMPVTGLDKRHILSRAAIDVKSGRRLSSPLLSRGRASWGLDMTKVDADEWQKYVWEQQSDVAGLRQAPHFGWTQQQVLILKDTLGICELLQDESSLLFFAAVLLRDFWPFLSAEDQWKLVEGIYKIQNSLIAKGQEALLEYWGPALILDDLQIVSQAQDIELTSVKVAVDQGSVETISSEKKKHQQPKASSNASVFIDGQVASFIVKLYNPMSISLQVEWLQLDVIKASSIGPQFEADVVAGITVPALSYQTVLLTGTPHAEGKLLLRGVKIKLASCSEKSFALERTDGEHVKVLSKLQSDIDDQWTRTKQVGLDARPSHRDVQSAKPKGRVEERHVPLQVVAKVPLLITQTSASLRNGSLTLLEGQERDIHLVLINKTLLPVDYIHFDFEDDLKTDMLDLLAEGQLDPVHVHELEEELLLRPFITPLFESNKALEISAGERRRFTFRIRGKLDVRRACIKVRYGNIQSAKELGRVDFWTRRAEVRFNVRVQPVISIDGLEASTVEEEEGQSNDKVLLGMRIHNLHSSSVTVDWQTSKADAPVRCHLAANTTTHIYTIMNKLSLSTNHLSQAIPNLIPRQFILSKIRQTAEQTRTTKRLFWTRAALIALIQIRKWTDDKTGDSGEISVAGLQLNNEHLLSMLSASPVRLLTRFNSDQLAKHDFVHLMATVTNASEEKLHGQYRLVPSVNERLLNHIQCTSGHLHGPLCRNGIRPGQSSDINIGLCFLASGTFAFTLQIVDDDRDAIIAEKFIQVIVS